MRMSRLGAWEVAVDMRKAFTLVELLVVVAIIAVLAAILFPVFLRVQDRARTQKCLAHGRQLAQACLMYMDDNNGRFPSAVPKPIVDELTLRVDNRYDWPGTPYSDERSRPWSMDLASYRFILLKKYVRNDDIWICPSPIGLYGQRYAYGYLCNWLPRNSDSWDDGSSAYKGFVDGDRGFQDRYGAGRTPAEVEGLDMRGETACGPRYMPPCRKVFWTCYAIGSWGKTNINPGTWVSSTFPDYPHNKGTTYLYVDGHAAWKITGKAWAPVGYTRLSMDADPG
jgi:prepilin-type N-terminal cleavage/methylation domain-containing protein/prepilin-type processing-associated H-X9-DG protein